MNDHELNHYEKQELERRERNSTGHLLAGALIGTVAGLVITGLLSITFVLSSSGESGLVFVGFVPILGFALAFIGACVGMCIFHK